MTPRTDDEVAALAGGLGLAFLAHAGVPAERPLAEDVEPAAEGVDGDADLLEDFLDVDLAPVVVVIGMGHPVFVELRVAPDKLLHGVQRHVPEDLVVADVFGTAFEVMRTHVLHDARFLPHGAPAEIERKTPAAVESDPVVIEAGGCDVGKDGDQARRVRHRGAPLHVSQVGASLHADFAVGPGLLGGPFDGVVAVLDVVAERLPLALRLMASASVLEDVGITAPGEVDGAAVGARVALGAVGRARNKHGVLAFADRTKDVRVEDDAVPHRDRDAVLHRDVVSGRNFFGEPPL